MVAIRAGILLHRVLLKRLRNLKKAIRDFILNGFLTMCNEVIMKKGNYFIFTMVLFFFCGTFPHMQHLDSKKISVKSVKIKKMIERHNYATASLSAIAAAQQLIFWASVFVPSVN